MKLFYMGAFENYREGTPNPLIVSYPEAEMRTGDFSKLVDASGQKITIYDPTRAPTAPRGNPHQPHAVPGNIIPANRINPIAKAVTTYMPMPNRAAPAGFRYATATCRCPTISTRTSSTT